MRSLIALLLIALSFSTAEAAPNNQYTPPECYPTVETLPIYFVRSTLKYLDKDGVEKLNTIRGSTFLVDKNYWVTNSHVLNYGEDLETVEITIADTTLTAEVILNDPAKDVAILYADSGDRQPIPLRSTPLKRRETLWAIGYPAIAGYYLMSFEGSTMGVDRGGQLVTSVVVFPGMSGGPTVRCNGDKLEAVSVSTALVSTPLTSSKRVLQDGTVVFHTESVNSGVSKSVPHIKRYLKRAKAIKEAQ